MKKYTGFDNSQLDSIFLQNGFYLSKFSKSNYNFTPLSIASTLNMAYFNKPVEGIGLSAEILMRADKEARISQVPVLLENNGYSIKNYGQFKLGHHPVATREFYKDYSPKAIYLQTLWGRIHRDIFWNFISRFKSDQSKEEMLKTADDNIQNLNSLISELKTETDQARFVYGHILLPHSPYVFDRNGNHLQNPVFHSQGAIRDSLYINQLIYANSWIREIIKYRGNNNKRPRVIIIEGDHGYRTKESNSREQQFMNLNAYYFSDGDYSLLYDSISPVNTFRIVFKKYFNADMPLLKDSTIKLGRQEVHQ